MRPLIYLELRQLVNSLKHALRSPKRLIPAAIIAAWLFSVISQGLLMILSRGHKNAIYPIGPVETAPAMYFAEINFVWPIIFVLLSITAAGVVYSALTEGLLVFSPAQIDFLFPLPINRRNVLAFKLFRDYIKYAIYAALFFSGIGLPLYITMHVLPFPDMIWSWMGAVCLVIFVINITHTLNIMTSFAEHRVQLVSRLLIVIMIGIAIILLASAAQHYTSSHNLIQSFTQAARHGIATIILAPIAWCTDLVMIPFTGFETRNIFQLLGLFVLALGSFAALVNRHENIYEPSLGISMKMARLKDAMKRGDAAEAHIQAGGWNGRISYSAPPIPAFGSGAWSIVWKNGVVRLRTMRWGYLLLIMMPLAALATQSYLKQDLLLAISPMAIPYLVWMLAMVSQQGIRGEMRRVNITKAMPISGFKIMAAQAFYEWLSILVVVLVAGASIGFFIPDVNLGFLTLSVVGSLSAGASCVTAVAIPVMLYSNSGDRLQELIVQAATFLLVGVILFSTFVLGALCQGLGASFIVTGLTIVITNGLATLGLLSIAGLIFTRFDPTAD